MAILRRDHPQRAVALAAHALVGRAPVCAVRLRDPRASGEHARLAWTGEVWEVRDLGSTNGTFVDGRRLEPGERVGLARGVRLAFGDARSVWILADDGPPGPVASQVGAPGQVAGEDGLLALPSADQPRLSVFEDAQGRWVVEGEDGGLSPAQDGATVALDGEAWVLHLPVLLERTWESGPQPPALSALQLVLTPSLDEEHVDVEVRAAHQSWSLDYRVHHHLLLLLARARLDDAAHPDVPEAEHGWVYVEDVCKMLRMDDLRLNTDVHRARRELARLGVAGAAGLVERRRGSRQLRLGVGDVAVRSP